jgi:hypothetical protein
MADRSLCAKQIWTRDLETADVLRLLLVAEAEIVPENQRMNPELWPSVAMGVLTGLIEEGVIKYPPIEVQL